MISTFNITQLSNLLKDFYTLTQIRITVFDEDFKEIASFPNERAPFCNLIRADSNALTRCIASDKEACQIVSKRHSPYIYQCHAGLTEAIAPIRLGNILIGYMLFGHVFSYKSHEEGLEKIKELCKGYNVDKQELETACRERPILTKEYILSASHILDAVASYLCLERMAVLKYEDLPVQIDTFIQNHLADECDSKMICEHFHIGRTNLYQISKQNYGIGIAEHIRNLRIEKAKSLLSENADIRISEVASSCGFNDYNYFISMFKRIAGMPPKQYQRIKFPDKPGE